MSARKEKSGVMDEFARFLSMGKELGLTGKDVIDFARDREEREMRLQREAEERERKIQEEKKSESGRYSKRRKRGRNGD
jgi:hypothetical protein